MSAPATLVGGCLGPYRVLALLGGGGMGEVYVGEQPALRRRVAIKVLRAELGDRTELVARFFTEARAAARVRHPGIVQVHDFGTTPEGRSYIVMELLEGESVGALAARGPLPIGLAVEIARQIAQVMAAAHAQGVIHRDLKPDNAYLSPDPELPAGFRVKVLDFGLAKLLDGTQHGLTASGALFGTPAFLSPEQCLSTGTVDHRTDVYALGCLLFALLCGRPPFLGTSLAAIVGSHLAEPPPDPASLREGLPAALTQLITRLLEKRPEDRPRDMGEVARALADIAATPAAAVTRWSPKEGAEAPPTPADPSTFAGSRGELVRAPSAGSPASTAGAPTRRGAPVALGLAALVLLGLGGRALRGGARPTPRAAPVASPRPEPPPAPAAPPAASSDGGVDAAAPPAPRARRRHAPAGPVGDRIVDPFGAP